MDCQQVREHLSASIDGALSPEKQRAVELHLGGCEDCSKFLALELKTKRLLRQRLSQPEVPSGLRERIIQAIGDASAASSRRRWAPPLWQRGPAAILALAGVVALVVALTIYYAGPRSIEASPFVSDSVNSHVKCLLGEYTMEVNLAHPNDLARWFHERLGFRVRLPRFAGQEQTGLWEGRVSLMGGVPSAQVFYRWKGKTLSLFILPGEAIGLMPGVEHIWNNRTFRVNHHRGYTSLMWREGDLAYCLVSDLSPEEVMAFASESRA